MNVEWDVFRSSRTEEWLSEIHSPNIRCKKLVDVLWEVSGEATAPELM